MPGAFLVRAKWSRGNSKLMPNPISNYILYTTTHKSRASMEATKYPSIGNGGYYTLDLPRPYRPALSSDTTESWKSFMPTVATGLGTATVDCHSGVQTITVCDGFAS